MTIKNTLWNLAAFALGGFVGYYIAEKRLRDQYKDDVLDVQEFYYDKLREAGVMDEDFEPPTDEEVLESFRQVTGYYDQDEEYSLTGKNKKKNKRKNESHDSAKEEKSKGRPVFNYSKPPLEKILSELEEEPSEEWIEDDEEEEEEFELDTESDNFVERRHKYQMPDGPYLIDYDEYEDSVEGYDKEILYYYSQDKVLCEDDDSIVDNSEELLGLDYEDELTLQTIAWVRNDYLLSLYEIHRIDASYQDTISNIRETPREREFRLVSRRKTALDDR